MEIKLGNCSTFSAHLVKPGNTDYRCTQAVIFGGRESRWQGGSSFCDAWLARWRRCDHAKFTIYFQPPHQTSLQSMWLPSLRMLSSHQPPFYSLLREKFQNTFWWLKNTTPLLYTTTEITKASSLNHHGAGQSSAITGLWAPAWGVCPEILVVFQNVEKLTQPAEKRPLIQTKAKAD